MIKWSFSGLKDYVNCPRQYHEVKILQNFTKKVTEQMLYGTEVHKALEDYVRDGTPLAKNYERFKELADSLLEIPGERHAEMKMALTKAGEACEFDGPDYWVRGIVDLMILDGDTAYVVDYKTGSAKYPDPKQLKLMALMIFAKFPQVNYIKAALVFVMHNVVVDEQYHRKDSDKLWDSFIPDILRLETSAQTGNWSPNPTPLCGWCPVEHCEFYKPKRRF